MHVAIGNDEPTGDDAAARPTGAARPPARTCWRPRCARWPPAIPRPVSANRIAKEIGATWGAVKYQFGDIDGFWAAVLHRTAERRGDLPALTRSRTRHCDERVAGDHRHPLRRADLHRFPRDREPARWHCPASMPNWNASIRAPRPNCHRGARAGSSRARRPSRDLDVDPERVREVATFIPGAMRGIVSERQLGTLLRPRPRPPRADNAIVAYLKDQLTHPFDSWLRCRKDASSVSQAVQAEARACRIPKGLCCRWQNWSRRDEKGSGIEPPISPKVRRAFGLLERFAPAVGRSGPLNCGARHPRWR